MARSIADSGCAVARTTPAKVTTVGGDGKSDETGSTADDRLADDTPLDTQDQQEPWMQNQRGSHQKPVQRPQTPPTLSLSTSCHSPILEKVCLSHQVMPWR